MATPYTTILSTLTVTDNTGATVSNLSICSLVVTFPDGTLSTVMSLGSGIVNLGAGQYQATYNTKGAGVMHELWNLVASNGTTIAQVQFEIGVGF